jgi:ferredoxin, 2Fe-2S
MPEVIFEHADGSSHVQEMESGSSIMETAVRNGIPGIVGECGGALSCSTCHVYLDEDSTDAFGPIEDLEEEMLDGVATERMPHSRLSCQLRPTGARTLRVRTPESQY